MHNAISWNIATAITALMNFLTFLLSYLIINNTVLQLHLEFTTSVQFLQEHFNRDLFSTPSLLILDVMSCARIELWTQRRITTTTRRRRRLVANQRQNILFGMVLKTAQYTSHGLMKQAFGTFAWMTAPTVLFVHLSASLFCFSGWHKRFNSWLQNHCMRMVHQTWSDIDTRMQTMNMTWYLNLNVKCKCKRTWYSSFSFTEVAL